MVSKYIKRPIVVEAVKFMGYNSDEVTKLNGVVGVSRVDEGNFILACDNGSTLHILPGVYVVSNPEDGVYAVTEESFSESYQKVSPRR